MAGQSSSRDRPEQTRPTTPDRPPSTPCVCPRNRTLLRLGRRLSSGLGKLPAEARTRHRAFVLSRQNADGGFSGREGGSDLYYTGFAVRTLAVLEVLTAEDCRRIADFLRSCQRLEVTVIDLVSWLYCALVVQAASGIDVLQDFDPAWPERLAETLESFRTKDGGYAKTHEGAAGEHVSFVSGRRCVMN